MVAWQHQVGLQDIDAAGIAFCGHFADWAHRAYEFELNQARINLLELDGIILPLKSMMMDFVHPVRHGTILHAEVAVMDIRTRSFSFRDLHLQSHAYANPALPAQYIAP